MFLSLALVGFLTLLFFFWFYLLRNTTGVPISPGWRYFTGHMHQFMGITRETFHSFEKIYFRLTDPAFHGPVSHMKFFFTSNISLNSVQVAEPLLKCNANINKSFQYNDFVRLLKDSVLILPGQEWYKRRRLLTPAFHFNILEDFSKTICRHAQILISDLEADPENHPVTETIQHIAFLSLCETSFNTTFESREEYDPYQHVLYEVNQALLAKSIHFTGLYWWSWLLTKEGRKYTKDIEILREFVMALIEKKRKVLEEGTTVLHNGKRSFLDLMLWEQREKGELTDDQIIGECNTMLVAGQGTTTGTLCFCLAYLCEHTEWQERLYKEIVDQLNGRDFSELDHTSLPLMNMVIKESLRLQPPASFVSRKLTQPLKTGGFTLPTGTNTEIGIYHIHRDPEHWENPQEFDPERFTAERSKGRNPYAFIPFSAGPRNCIGQRFAQMEMRILLSAMVYNFKFSSQQRMGRELVRIFLDLTATAGPDFRVTFTKRGS